MAKFMLLIIRRSANRATIRAGPQNNAVITSESFAHAIISAGQTGTSLSLAKQTIKKPCPACYPSMPA